VRGILRVFRGNTERDIRVRSELRHGTVFRAHCEFERSRIPVNHEENSRIRQQGSGQERTEMKKVITTVVWGLLMLGWSMPAFSLLMERELRGQDLASWHGWSADLKKLVVREGIVYAIETDAPTFGKGYHNVTVCFVGDADAFNDVLKQYARLRDTPLTLMLHPGRGTARTLRDDRRDSIACDWQIRIVHTGRMSPEPAEREKPPTVILQLWVGGDVELGKVKVPDNVEVKSVGEIERFIAAHEAKRKELQNSGEGEQDDEGE
jgi:hypothetical protein